MRNIPLLFFFIMICAVSSAQELSPVLIGSGGGVNTVGKVTLSYSLGETVTTTINNSSNTLTQGFQQGSILLVSNQENNELGTAVSMFPNPAQSFVQINSRQVLNNASLRLYSTNGKKILDQRLPNDLTDQIVDLTAVAPGLYHLQVIQSSQILHHEKLIIR